MRLVLASASPRRLDLLRQIGLSPDAIVAPDIDETPLPAETPRGLARRLAARKAEAVSGDDRVVLAGDTVVACGRRILPKAETEEEARACLVLLSGRQHQVISAVALLRPGAPVRVRDSVTRVRFKRLRPAEIDAYLRSGEWMGKAGGYGVQGRAGRFVIALNGSYTGVVGLPLFETTALLEAAGLGPP